MLTCSTEHRGTQRREETDPRGSLQEHGERVCKEGTLRCTGNRWSCSDNHCPPHSKSRAYQLCRWPWSHSKCGWVQKRGWGHLKGRVQISVRRGRWKEGRSQWPRIGCAVGGCRLTPDLPLPLHFLPLVRRVLHVRVCAQTQERERERQSHQAS